MGHWQTNDDANTLGFEACTLTADDMQIQYTDYWDRIVEEKVVSIHLEMGRNTMSIIMTTIIVITLGSLLRLSLIKRYDAPDAWMRRFYPILVVLVVLPLFNFSNFLLLASRSVRILWYYCDDCASRRGLPIPRVSHATLSHAIEPCDCAMRLSHAIVPCDCAMRLCHAIVPCD